MPRGLWRRLPLLLAIGAPVLVGVGPASAGRDAPKPCVVEYGTHAVADQPVTSTFAVSCGWWVDTVIQQTSIRDLVTRQGADCDTVTYAAAATQSCASGTAKKLHSYAVTFFFQAHGNFLVCADDGGCDDYDRLAHPACTPDALTDDATFTHDVILSCTYRTVVAVRP